MLDNIKVALEAALLQFTPSKCINYELSQLLHLANDKNPAASPVLVSLLSSLADTPQLDIFRGTMQVIPGLAIRFDYVSLAYWLLDRAERQSSKKALEDLNRYIGSNEIPVQWVSAIEGLKLTRRCSITESISLLPWKDYPHSQHKDELVRYFVTRARHPSSLLIHDVVIQKIHVHPDQVNSTPLINIHYDDSDVLLCAGLLGPSAPIIVASWLELPDWMPSWGTGFSFPIQTDVSHDTNWPENAYKSLPKLYKQFKSLSEKKQRLFRVPLGRLNSAIRRHSPVDSAIDIGIALEALFLSDLNEDHGELTFRLRVRGAKYLSNSFDSRIAIYRSLGLLYRLRSIAVHTGILPNEIDGHNVNEILKQGYNIISKALIKMINIGSTDWTRLVLE